MSVRLNGTSDYLRTTFPILTVGTGNVTVLAWIKIITDLNVEGDVYCLGDQVNPTGTHRYGPAFDTDGTGILGYPNGVGPLALSVNTWYGIVMRRTTGSNNHFMGAWEDNSNTEPLLQNAGTLATDFNAWDNLLIGNRGGAIGSADIEITNVKILTGVGLSYAQIRTELDYFAIQAGGATEAYAWELEDIDADSHGLNERSGTGYNLTNSGAVVGASRPSQLESVSDSPTRSPGKISSFGITPMSIRPSISNRIVIS